MAEQQIGFPPHLREIVRGGMALAVDLAREAGEKGNYPIGAVVADANGVISAVGSKLVEGHDPSAHPEMIAIRNACEQRKSRYISGAYLISTLEPCPMCAAAAVWAKMSGIVYALSQDDAVMFGRKLEGTMFPFRQIHVRCAHILNHGEPKLGLTEGFERATMMQTMERFIAGVKDDERGKD